jgi:hypothetical protein
MTVIAPQWQLERMGVDSSAMLSGSASLWVLRERELSSGNVDGNHLLLGQENCVEGGARLARKDATYLTHVI